MTTAAGPRPHVLRARLGLGDAISVGIVGLRARPLRASLSALGIAIGIGAMVAVLGIAASSRAQLSDELGRLGTNLLTVTPGQTLFGDNAELPVGSVGMVRRIGPVTSATATGKVSATVRRNDRISSQETGGLAVLAARTDLLPTIGAAVRTGTFLNAATERYPAVVLGAVAAQRLGISGLSQTVQVWIGNRWFTVIGILAPIPLAPEIDRAALVGFTVAQADLGFDGHPSTIYERSTDSQVPAVQSVLAGTVDPQHPDQVTVSRPSDALAAELAAKNTFTGLFLGLGAVALVVGGVGVANTMVISVLERRREIGMRRSLGATRGQIRGQFVTESLVLSLLGGLAGAALGAAVTIGYAVWRGWPSVVPGSALGLAAAASLGVGALAGIYPATRAARLSPVEALVSL